MLGGTLAEGDEKHSVRSESVVADVLSGDFEFVREAPFPHVIREHERKFQFSVPHMMVWRRRVE